MNTFWRAKNDKNAQLETKIISIKQACFDFAVEMLVQVKRNFRFLKASQVLKLYLITIVWSRDSYAFHTERWPSSRYQSVELHHLKWFFAKISVFGDLLAVNWGLYVQIYMRSTQQNGFGWSLSWFCLLTVVRCSGWFVLLLITGESSPTRLRLVNSRLIFLPFSGKMCFRSPAN